MAAYGVPSGAHGSGVTKEVLPLLRGVVFRFDIGRTQ